jgi:hypothetical protein
LSYPHLGSAICADCFTRPQYVDRSYWDAGRSRLPGNDADIDTRPQLTTLYQPLPNANFKVEKSAEKRRGFLSGGGVLFEISHSNDITRRCYQSLPPCEQPSICIELRASVEALFGIRSAYVSGTASLLLVHFQNE